MIFTLCIEVSVFNQCTPVPSISKIFEPDQTKVYIIGICCFSAKHAAIRRKNKDWLVRNQNNVFEWSDMSIRRLLFQ